jgi:hypothetical protein
MDVTCRTHEEERSTCEILVEKSEAKRPLEIPGVDKMIILS